MTKGRTLPPVSIPSASATWRPISAWLPQVLLAVLLLLGVIGSWSAQGVVEDLRTRDAGGEGCFASCEVIAAANHQQLLGARVCVQDSDEFATVAEAECEGSERDDEEHDPSDAELAGGSHPRAPPPGPRVDHWNRRVHHAESRRLCGARAPPTRA